MTPMMRQYLEVKEKCPDAILFYRIGDFYEMFYEDAVIASKVLDIVLTSRNKNDPVPIPLCGIPHHSMQPYLEKLVEKGYKVAICDQVEDPKTAKGVVRRDVVRVVTPGLVGYLESVSDSKPVRRTLASVFIREDRFGLALLDIAAGSFSVAEIQGTLETFKHFFEEESQRAQVNEVVISETLLPAAFSFSSPLCLSRLPAWVWEEGFARKTLHAQFGTTTLSGFDCEDIPCGVIAAGAALHYVKETQRTERLAHITSLKRFSRGETMRLGEESRKNLGLEELFDLMDRTQTPMGRRKLRDWLYSPLIEKQKIENRLDAVQELSEKKNIAARLRDELAHIYDLESPPTRLAFRNANARDLVALGASLQALKNIHPLLSEMTSGDLQNLYTPWNHFDALKEEIQRSLVDTPPFGLKEGGLIREGFSTELDELRRLRHDTKGAIAAMEDRERKNTGINSLKIHFNRVFGYYLEVSSTHLEKVPAHFIRKQTLANAERFITPELKEFEDKVLGAEERIKALEYDYFCTLRDRCLESAPLLQEQAQRVAVVDALLSLATYAVESKCVRPHIEENLTLKIEQGRHPLVETHLPTGSYVPNDFTMHGDVESLFLITGPNMAGKSTSIRQVGVLVLMAQCGSFVPAAKADIGLVDQIFTRVGASDRLARGESTFMVEMCETAAILHHATKKSLILLDEIGRGTSTFDGVSIAWAVAEYIHDALGARTLFATHYHELLDLALTKTGIKNYHVEVKEDGGDITFLYRLVPGGTSHSYGIHVAKLAGLPAEVLQRAQEVLDNLEQNKLSPEGAPRIGRKRKKSDGQMSFF